MRMISLDEKGKTLMLRRNKSYQLILKDQKKKTTTTINRPRALATVILVWLIDEPKLTF